MIAFGQKATGIVAVGQLATGVIAIGQLARGVIVVGQMAVGFVALGQLAVGVAWVAGMIGVGGTSGGILVVAPFGNVSLASMWKMRPKFVRRRPFRLSGWSSRSLPAPRSGSPSPRSHWHTTCSATAASSRARPHRFQRPFPGRRCFVDSQTDPTTASLS